MKRRLIAYLGVGVLFGIFDFCYLDWLGRFSAQDVFGASTAARMLHFAVFFLVLNLGIWLVVVIPVVLYEARCSGSRWRSALTGLVVWTAGIVAYYLTDAAQLAVGVAGREELALSQYNTPHFWQNWASVLQGHVLGGVWEYAAIAILGGALTGLLASSIYLKARAASPRKTMGRATMPVSSR